MLMIVFWSSVKTEENVLMESVATCVTVLQDTWEIIARQVTDILIIV